MLETLAIVFVATLQPQEAEPQGKTSKWIGITVDAEYWMADLSGTTGAGYPVANPNRPLDLRNDLMLTTGGSQTYGLRYSWVDPKRAELTFGFQYRGGRWSGSGVLQEDLYFDGVTFPAGSSVASQCRLDDYTLEFEGRIPIDDGNLLQFLIGASFGVIICDERLTGSVQADSLLGADLQYGARTGLRVRPFPFAYGELSAGVSAGYIASVSFDLKVAVGANWGPLRLEIGYRFQSHRQFDLNAELGGFFVGLAGDF
jgi:hypothetical protein